MENPYYVPTSGPTPNPVPQYPQYPEQQFVGQNAPIPPSMPQYPQYQMPQMQYPEQPVGQDAPIPPSMPQYSQYQTPQSPQYSQPKPPRTELVCEIAPEDKKINTRAFYRPLIRWGWAILAVSGGISLLTLALLAGGVI